MPENSITHKAFVSTPIDENVLPFDTLTPEGAQGQRVVIPDGRIGTVEKFAVSSYWPEEREGIVRVYVVSELFERGGINSWTDWVLPTELVVLR